MFCLEAVGQQSNQRGFWVLAESRSMLMGRSTDNDCPIPWDSQVSRKHAELMLEDELLRIECFPSARNRIFFNSGLNTEVTLTAGQECRIGNTLFRFRKQSADIAGLGMLDDGLSESASTTDVLVKATDYRISIVSRNAPDLWVAESDESLAEKTVALLRQIMPNADLLAVLESLDVTTSERPQVVYWEKPEGGGKVFVSRRLIRNAIADQETAIQVETSPNGEPIDKGRWAFCVPVPSQVSKTWCIYVGGAFGEGEGLGPRLKATELRGDSSITELLAQLVGAIRYVRSLEGRFAGVRQFFSPSVVAEVSATQAIQNLAPREAEVVVMYCDLRGFTRMVEQSGSDLHGLLDRVSAALGVMTHSIIELNGVIADFQGDSVLGFWGWPLELHDGPLPACRAALQIQRVFEHARRSSDPQLSPFRVGIGIASGQAIAGRIGTRDQAKVGVFGSAVNIASRLEGLTKKVGVPILMDETTARHVNDRLPDNEGRSRKIGRMQLLGLESPIGVSELLPPESRSRISNREASYFDGAVGAFESGDWEQARTLLDFLPSYDRAKDFLLLQIAGNDYQPPKDWDGVISLRSK